MDLPNKSDQQPPKKKVEQVVTGATMVDRPATKRFLGFLFAESPKELGKSVGQNVIVPRLKAGLEEALNSFIHGMFWGGGASPLAGLAKGTVLRGGGINYQGVSTPPSALQQAQAASQPAQGPYRDVALPTQQQAEILLANMYTLFNDYRVVAVGDLYEAAGKTPSPQDNAYGWYSLDGARIVKSREGYVLEMPRPTRIG